MLEVWPAGECALEPVGRAVPEAPGLVPELVARVRARRVPAQEVRVREPVGVAAVWLVQGRDLVWVPGLAWVPDLVWARDLVRAPAWAQSVPASPADRAPA